MVVALQENMHGEHSHYLAYNIFESSEKRLFCSVVLTTKRTGTGKLPKRVWRATLQFVEQSCKLYERSIGFEKPVIGEISQEQYSSK